MFLRVFSTCLTNNCSCSYWQPHRDLLVPLVVADKVLRILPSIYDLDEYIKVCHRCFLLIGDFVYAGISACSGGDQAQVYRHFVQVRTRSLPDQRREGQDFWQGQVVIDTRHCSGGWQVASGLSIWCGRCRRLGRPGSDTVSAAKPATGPQLVWAAVRRSCFGARLACPLLLCRQSTMGGHTFYE